MGLKTDVVCKLWPTFLIKLNGKSIDASEEKPIKHVRVEASAAAGTKMTGAAANGGSEKRVVTMEPSARSFAGPSAARRDRSDPIMITDALADVRAK